MSVSRRGLILVLVLVAGATVYAQSGYKVTRIVDGDTVVLAELGTVRLIGVDTPETVDPRRPVEEFGRQSAAFLSYLVLGKTVRVEYDQTRKDRFNRTLAYLYLPDGRFVNKEIIRLGYGHAYVKYPFKYMEEFQAAAREAQRDKLGLWAVQLSPDAITTVATTAAPLGLLSAAALPATAAPTVAASNADETVYVTKSGTKYHVAGCRSLSKSQIPMTLKEAAARYGACSICRPPSLADTGAAAAPLPVTSSPRQTAIPAPTPKASSQQCAATTKAGSRCKRTASPGSAYCWQHDRSH